MKKLSNRSEIADCVFLFAVVLCSALPYLYKLGFYIDDWGYQATLAHSAGKGIGVMVRELLNLDAGMLVRPVQIAYLVLGFKAFGRHATAYHAVNSVVLGLSTVLLYFVLRELRTGRWIAFVIALVFGLLPHYSTDRFWISAHQATLSMAFAFLGICALLRSGRSEDRCSKTWLALAVVSLTLSILSYEVALGLIVASLVLLGTREYLRMRAESRLTSRHLGAFVIAIIVLLLVCILKVRMQTRITTHGHFLKYFLAHIKQQSWHAVVQAVQFNFWSYGLKMPAVLVNLYRHSALSLAAVCSASLIAILVAAYLWKCMGSSTIPDRRACLWLILLGFPLFGLGFGLFFFDPRADFSTAGIDNRIAIASALGAACMLVGIVGMAASILTSDVARVRACSVAIGAICGMNCLVLYGIGFYWAGAASQQSAILRTVASNVRALPAGSVLLLDGFCRYYGPGVVFETDWDSTGAIQLLLGNPSLSSDVVSPNLRLRDTTVRTTIYGDPEGNYPYGDHLFVFNVQRQTFTSLPSKEAASAYFRAANPAQDSGCPAAEEGRGAKVF
jgi:hypothetical protein